jgi:hypothetical protein
MINPRILVMIGAVAIGALSACNNDASKAADTSKPAAAKAETTKADPAKAAPAPPPPAAPAPEAAKAKPVLEDSTNKAMGYTIKLPKEATTAATPDKNGGSYSYGTMIIMVGPTGVALKTPDDVLRAVNTTGGTIEKKTIGDAVVAIVTKPASPIGVYAGPKGKKFAATCLAEPSQKDLAIEICSSLTAAK